MSATIAALLLFAPYVWAYRAYYARFREKELVWSRLVYFALGTLVLIIALAPPLERLADGWFAWHMLQHIALLLIAPPLLLLGAPLLYALGALPQRTARGLARILRVEPLHTLLSPVPAWLAFVAVLWVSHFSALYNAALENPGVHVFEHGLYLGVALLFWSTIVQTGYIPHPVSFPARMLYLFLAIPQGAFLGLALYQTRTVLYSHYATGRTLSAALADQHNAGAIMWMAGGLLFFSAFMLTTGMWAIRERTPQLGYTAL